MQIITAAGEIVEGQELSNEELEIIKELSHENTGLFYALYDFISIRSKQSIIAHLFKNYKLTRRVSEYYSPEISVDIPDEEP